MKRHTVLAALLLCALLAGCAAGPAPGSSDASSVTEVMTEPAPAVPSAVSPAPAAQQTPAPPPEPEPQDYTQKLFSGDILAIDISVPREDWDYLMSHAMESPWIAADLTVNGETFSNVGIRTKGNTSLTSVAVQGSQRYSFKVSFGKYEEDQTCWGLDKLALNNLFADNTYMKEYMSYHLFRYMHVPASLCTYCDVTLNGEPFGFYLAIEDTDKSFLARYGGEDNRLEAYKPEMFGFGFGGNAGNEEDKAGGEDDTEESPERSPFSPPGGGFPAFPGPPGFWRGDGGVSLKYVDDDPESYYAIFDNSVKNVSDRDKQKIILCLKAISEGEDLETYINVDEVLRYTACNVFLVNMDSYLSMMGHNYVLVEDRGQLSMVPWDYNLSFGTHNLGSAGAAVNYAVDTVFSGVSAEDRPIIGRLLEVDAYRQRYHDYLREICEDYVAGGVFDGEIDRVDELIAAHVKADPSSFTGYDAYVSGVSALRLFGALRARSVMGQLDGSIPSLYEAQTDSGALVDASALDLDLLGSMGMGRRPPGGFAAP